ncbi:MAG: fructose-6-phosphate aldolase [Clostridia bacterium]|nr:fructose-6-phosphate aldolase [Clostridia bacterium]
MKLILDTANLDDIRYFNTYYPISGVTTNPTILSREGGDIVKHLKTIREIIGEDKELHIQVTETEFEKIVAEAKLIVKTFGKNTFVKIPATDVGLRATAALSKEGIGVTVTAVFSAGQALLAATAGASYVAPYVSRLENICEDGVGVVAEIQQVFDCDDYKTVILAASFKTAREVLDVALAGAGAATVSADVLKKLLSHTSTDTSIAGFEADWKKAFGDAKLSQLLKG